MKNVFRIGTLLIAMLVILPGILMAGGRQEQAGEKKIDLSIALHLDPGHPVFKIGERLRDTLPQKTNGRISTKILGLEVGGERDQIEGCSNGEYDITLGGSVPLTLYAPQFAAPDLPFIFPDTQSSRKLYEGELGKRMNEALIKKGNMRLVGLTYRPPRHLTANKPIRTTDDLRGLKLRVPQIATWVKVWNSLGALTSPIAWPEVYTSLQTGVIEAQENPVDILWNSRIYEVQKYLIETGHVYSFFHWLMNEKFHNSLSDSDRKIVLDSIAEVTKWGDDYIMGMEGDLFKKLTTEGKMQAIKPDMKAFMTKAYPVLQELAKEYDPEVAKYLMSFFTK